MTEQQEVQYEQTKDIKSNDNRLGDGSGVEGWDNNIDSREAWATVSYTDKSLLSDANLKAILQDGQLNWHGLLKRQ